MNAIPATWNRFVTLVLSAAFLVVGGATIAWQLKVTWVRDRIADIDQNWFQTAPDQSWWKYSLAGIAAGTIVFGLVLLIVNARPRKTGTVVLPGSDRSGVLSANPAKIAKAVADDLEHNRVISSAKAKAVDDRKRRLLEVTVTADPRYDYADVLTAVQRAEEQVAAALPGSDVRPRFLIHLEKTKLTRVE
ncbi:hypothetical protein [Williamsia sp. CHRR-6]|uniref:hypothetical protein n=1 Tax=Williamsia sp. CHRR-6 TaxID=2835871 RepID=UPI001BDB3F96|nr:hypothetical protein [Williamsia sp. CHRR-6]MBT0567300.1 hypothetical protein [Williamsia sp. CHRR-6]